VGSSVVSKDGSEESEAPAFGNDGSWRRINSNRGWSVSGNNRKDMYFTKKAEEEGRVWVEGMRLIKSDITRNTYPTSNGVPTPIALMLITVSKKDTQQTEQSV
jgi:hypothetical protein